VEAIKQDDRRNGHNRYMNGGCKDVLKCACIALSLKGKCKFKIVDFSRFAAIAHRNSNTHCYLMFIQIICRCLLQHCLYKASVSLLYYLLVDQTSLNTKSVHHAHFRTKCTLVRAFNKQKCKFVSSIGMANNHILGFYVPFTELNYHNLILCKLRVIT